MYVGELLKSLDRVSTGVPGLDDLIGGGFLPGRAYLLVGPPGSGKTTMGIQFLVEGAKNGERGIFLSLYKNPELITNEMLRYNFGLLGFVQSKRIVFYDLGDILFSTGKKFTWDEILAYIIGAIENEKGVKRVVVDSFTPITGLVVDRDNKRLAIGRFIRKLHSLEVTSILISEMMDPDRYTDEYYFTDGVIVLHHFMRNFQMIRALQVLKMHGIAHDSNLKRIKFTDEGVRVYPEAPF